MTATSTAPGYVTLPAAAEGPRYGLEPAAHPENACTRCERKPRLVDGELCRKCQGIADDVARLRVSHPYSVFARSTLPPYQVRPLSGERTLAEAKRRGHQLRALGYREVRVEDDRTGERWPVTR